MSQPDTAAAAIADQLATFIQDSLLLGKPTDVRGRNCCGFSIQRTIQPGSTLALNNWLIR